MWYAKEKAEYEEAREVRTLGGPAQGERLMIEGGLVDEEEKMDADAELQEDVSRDVAGNGILSSSTLAALKGYKATSAPKRPAPASGPLVGYGSDDDSD